MAAASLAETVRGGILLIISIGICAFFFADAWYNIFRRKKTGAEKKEESGEILCRVRYQGKLYGEDAFLPIRQSGKLLVGFGSECDLDLHTYPLPREAGEDGIWFQILKNSAGVLMLVKDPAMDGLRVREPEDREYRSFRTALFRSQLQVEKNGLVVILQRQDV